MNKSQRLPRVFIIQLLLFSAVFLIHCNDFLYIPKAHANAVLLLPLFISFCMFCQETTAAITGLIIGFFWDSVSSTGSYFHAIFLFIVGLTAALLVHYMLNNNFRSAIMLSLVTSLVYFFLRWLFFHAFSSDITNSVQYLMQHALPSVIYTNLFVVPLYFLQSRINRIHK